jgi:hypothetical protein
VPDIVRRAEPPSGTEAATLPIASSVGASRAMPSVPPMGPGTTELMRIPSRPHSIASVRVIMSTPALAAETWLCPGIGRKACGAEMLMTLAPGFFR